MRSGLQLTAVVVFGILAGTAPVRASIYIEPGPGAMHYDFLSALSSAGADVGACVASQCDLLEQKSAADALAKAAGAGPATSMNRPAVAPDPWRKGPFGVSGAFSTTAPKQTSDVDSVLFTVIEQNRVAQGQLCMEEGNLLGLAPTCAHARLAATGSSIDCPNGSGYDRLGRLCSNPGEGTESCTNRPGFNRLGILCDPQGAPEPGTLALLAIALLALAAARVRSALRKVSPTRL